jgi:hypothetical protein
MRGRLLALIAALVLVAAGCRLDVDVAVVMDADGAGTITVTAVADPELVAEVPGLAEDLRLDDFRTAGWASDGPTATPDGGLQVVLTHDVVSPDQANDLLASLNGEGGPFHGLTLARTVDGDSVTFAADGTLQVVGGIDAFSDAYVASLGAGTPFAETLAARGEPLDDDLGIELSVALPGDVDTDATLTDAGASWQVPLDGSAATVAAASTTKESHTFARLLSWLALAALIVWIVVAIAFITYVARNRGPRTVRR